ncbi:MAG: tripartite tricarboxylate transporter substrate binding protein [Albidovulum sp.]|nr:tripartite tricarboxylate transporter substrate binding protein [Albidovulum sp.]MDE0532520.1 tripartite tricarboxylate transporter substrate binding protein [Albidovulum sp.]
MKNPLKATSVGIILGLLASPVLADWPEQPIKITIPWKAGAGAVDQMTRQLQKTVSDSEIVDQPITIFNVGGPIPIGLRQAKDHDPDGYNFVVMHTAMMTLQAADKIDFGYKDFEPVARLGQFCQTTSVHKDTGIETLDELLDKAAAEPNTLVHGANLGAINHVYGIMVEDLREGAKFRFVQTGGDAGTFPEFKGGRVQVAGFSAAGATNFALGADGMPDPESPVRLLAYAGSERHRNFSDVPTFHELGYDFQFCVDGWYFAPKGTPNDAIDGFANMVREALNDEGMQSFLSAKAMVGAFQAGDELMDEMDRQWEAIEPIAARAAKK